mmetsp:Transcript_18984/g.59686  ORF Transcript_18984/g.59686 Transcript_18984/m.59686 type:complete len:228 (+) Transcript_18984:40-723(+)
MLYQRAIAGRRLRPQRGSEEATAPAAEATAKATAQAPAAATEQQGLQELPKHVKLEPAHSVDRDDAGPASVAQTSDHDQRVELPPIAKHAAAAPVACSALATVAAVVVVVVLLVVVVAAAPSGPSTSSAARAAVVGVVAVVVVALAVSAAVSGRVMGAAPAASTHRLLTGLRSAVPALVAIAAPGGARPGLGSLAGSSTTASSSAPVPSRDLEVGHGEQHHEGCTQR